MQTACCGGGCAVHGAPRCSSRPGNAGRPGHRARAEGVHSFCSIRPDREGPRSQEAKGAATSPHAVFPASRQHTGAGERGEDLSWPSCRGPSVTGTLDFISDLLWGLQCTQCPQRERQDAQSSGSSGRKEKESGISSQCSGSTAGSTENAWKSRWGRTPSSQFPMWCPEHHLPPSQPLPRPSSSRCPPSSSSRLSPRLLWTHFCSYTLPGPLRQPGV